MDKTYGVLGKEEEFRNKITKKDKEEIKERIRQIHELKPDYIIFATSSSLGWQPILREGLKAAYPNDKEPYFLNMDPRPLQERYYEKNLPEAERIRVKQHKKINEFILAHSKNPKKARILLLDEPWGIKQKDGSFNKPYYSGYEYDPRLSNYENQVSRSKQISGHFTTESALPAMEAELMKGWYGTYSDLREKPREFNNIWSLNVRKSIPSVYFRAQHYAKDDPFIDVFKVVRFARGKEGLNIMRNLRRVGRNIGLELRKEKDLKKKTLEQIVSSVLLIFGVGLFAFLFSNFSSPTGFAINNFSGNAGFGVGLIIVLVLAITLYVLYRKRMH